MPVTEAVDLSGAAAQLEASVREAGALALSMFGTPLKNWIKGVSSPVCEADIAVDELLHNQLRAVDPAIGWLSEESLDDPARLTLRYVWIVDQIDGTRAYIAGSPDWAISAALVEQGRPIAACLFAPARQEFFMATAARGATLNRAAIAATSAAGLKNMRIAGPKNFLERMVKVAPPLTIEPRVPSLALRLARVAQGAIDAAIAGGNSHDWDLAAADLLVHEAGGTLTTFNGKALIYNRPEPRHGMLVATGRGRHAALLQLLKNPLLTPSPKT